MRQKYHKYKSYEKPKRKFKITPRKVQKALNTTLLLAVIAFVCFQLATCIHNQTTAPSVPEKSEQIISDNSKSENFKPESSKPESSKLESSKPESSKPESSKPESSKPESSKPESSKPESSKPESSKPESSKAESSKAESSKPTDTYIYFKGTAFLGNSLISGFDVYNIEPNADYYWSVGMSAYGALHSPMTGSENTAVEEICKHKYKQIFLMFGTNELGWNNVDGFISNYAQVIDEIHAAIPNTEIYIQSITPVTAAVDKKNQNGINNTRIEQYNAQLQNLAAEKNVGYLDIASIYKDENGNMDDKYSGGDGIHLSPNAYYLWLDYIMEYTEWQNVVIYSSLPSAAL